MRRRKKNRGWFKKGVDPRRSKYRLTKRDAWKGFLVTVTRHPHLVEWLRRKILFGRKRGILDELEAIYGEIPF